MKTFWKGMLDRSWWIIAAFAVLTVFMAVGATHIVQDASADALNPDNNAIVQLNDQISREFNSGRTEVFVLRAPDVFTPGHLTEVRALTAALEGVTGVKKVTSLSNTKKMVETDGLLVSSDMVESDNPSGTDIAALRQYLATNYATKSGMLAAADGSSTNVVVEFEDAVDLPTIAAAMEAAVKQRWTGTYDLTGLPSMESYMLNAMHIDMPTLGGTALVIILLMFLFNFRSPLGMWLPLLQVVVGLVWGAGLYGWLHLKFGALTIIAPVAVLAVGSSFTLHLLGRYFLELSQGTEKRQAILNVLGKTGLGVFVSGLAITASMLTFLLSDLAMVRGIGVLCATGVFTAMVSSLTLVPSLLNVLGAPKVRVKLEDTGVLSHQLSRLGRWIGRHPRAILLVGVATLVIAAFGIGRIVPNTSLVGFFKPDSSVVRGMNAVDEVFGGSTAVKALVSGDLQDPQVLKGLLAFQEDLKTTAPQLGASTSLATLVRSLHETLTGEAGMPASRELVAQELLVYQASGSVDDITSLTNLDYTRGVVTIVAPRLPTHETKALLTKLQARTDFYLGSTAKVQFAGDILSEVAVEDTIVHDFILSLTLAILLVILIDSMIRSVRAALVTITVLISTIVLQYGILGLAGLPFNLATALAGALAIGVGDYAIHLTVRYMEDRQAGLSPEDAVVSALATSGRSVFFTALTLGGGFLALTFSQMVPVSTLGGVMVLTVMIVGLFTLTILPAACLIFLRNPRKPKSKELSHA
ncbi:MAG: MMPL family transporter [Spirochaetales bacterium]